MRQRVKMVVEADLDPTMGMFHLAEDWQTYLSRLLKDVCPHYNPSVRLYNEKDE